ncbi:hypothetical protein ACNOYE_27240 [Nannocystaceae bacterium ST9]
MTDLFVARDPLRIATRLRRPSKHGGTPLRGVLSVAMLLISLVALGILTIAREEIAAQVESPMAAKLQAADRVLYYQFDQWNGPRFQLSPADRSLKMITHLVLPPDTEYDQKAEFRYGVELRLTSMSGDLLWSQVVDIGTRQSKDGGTARGWLIENSFLIGDERELTDDRLTRIRLPPAGPDEGDRVLELRLTPELASQAAIGLARVYARRPRPVDDRTLRELSLAPDQRRELVDDLTYRDWDQLSEAERDSKLRWVWDRLASLGEPNLDYWTMTVYETGFRLPRESLDDTQWLRVAPLRSLAFNLSGPVELELRTHTVDPSLGPARISLGRVGVDGSLEELVFEGTQGSLSLPAGVQTLFIETDRPVDVELAVVEGEFDPVRFSDRPQRIGDEGSEQLEPDLRRLPVIWLHPAREGVGAATLRPDGLPFEHPRPAGARYRVSLQTAIEREAGELPPLAEPASRLLRFDVRYVARFADRWPESPPVPELELCFFDDRGAMIDTCEVWTGRRPIRSPFEGRRVEATGEGDERWYPVSEPQTVRTVVPDQATMIEVRTSQSLLVRGYGFWPEVETTLADPWKTATSELTRWRYPVLDERTWFPLLPDNHDALEEHGMTADLIAQIRLMPVGLGGEEGEGGWRRDFRVAEAPDEPEQGEDGWDPGPWVTVDPIGRHLRRSLLEQLDDEADIRLRERWSASLFTTLALGRGFTVDLSATGPSAPELHYQTSPDLLGRTLVLAVGDRVVRHELTSTRGALPLPIESGQVEVRVDIEGEAGPPIDLWIDRPVLVDEEVDEDLPISRRRVVHELTSRSLVIPFEKPGIEPMILNVVVYVPRVTEQATLRALVDEGNPPRRQGETVEWISAAEREFRLDANALLDERERVVDRRARVRFVDLEGQHGAALQSVTFPIVLGEDIAPGSHQVRVSIGEGRVWIRAFHRGVGDQSKPATAWTESNERLEGGDW